MKKMLLDWFKLHFLEASLLTVLIFGFLIYVIFLKTHSTKKTIYLEASLQYGDVKGSEAIPLFFIEGLKKGDKNDDKKVTITDIVTFQERKQDWMLSTSSSFVGWIQFSVEAEALNEGYVYKEQQMKVGNPFIVSIDNRHLEFLITKIQDKPFDRPNYKKSIVTAKIYGKKKELLPKINPGYEFKDSNGESYAKVLEIKEEFSPFVVTNQAGEVFLKRDPLNHDMILTIETLSLEVEKNLIGYDGRRLVIGERFYLNDPLLANTDAYIIDISN